MWWVCVCSTSATLLVDLSLSCAMDLTIVEVQIEDSIARFQLWSFVPGPTPSCLTGVPHAL